MTTTYDAAPASPSPGAGRRFLHPATVLAVAFCALASFGLWGLSNRPASPPDFTGTVAGLAFSPFQRGQSPETGAYPSRDQVRADLKQAAETTGRIRTYSAEGVLGEIPRLAAELNLHITAGAWLARDPAA